MANPEVNAARRADYTSKKAVLKLRNGTKVTVFCLATARAHFYLDAKTLEHKRTAMAQARARRRQLGARRPSLTL